MEAAGRRTLERVYSAVLLAVVILSWSYVIYAGRVASNWLLERGPAPTRD